MRSFRPLREWPRALSARRLVLLATVAGLGVAGAAVGPNLFHQAKLPIYATASAAESVQRPAGFADLVAKVKPAVISVRVKMDAGAEMMGFDGDRRLPPNSQMQRFFHHFGMPNDETTPDNQRQPNGHFMMAQGSGFFITADGYAVTNNHVVDKAKAVEITTDDGKTYDAKVVGTDARTDLALIKVGGRSDFPYVKLAETSPRIGDWVVAVGNPFGLGGTVTAGIVSARGRDIGSGPYDDFIQIDAPVNKGNSGGPTFDMEGNVIGVNTAIFSPSGGSVGIAFDIPAETVKTVVAQLKDKGMVSRGWIGVNSAGHPRHRREFGPKGNRGRTRRRAASRQPRWQGRHSPWRRDHRSERPCGQGCTRPREANRFDEARRNCQTHRLAQRRGEELLADARRGAEGASSTRGWSRFRRSRSELAETWLVTRPGWGDCRQRLRRPGRD